MKHISRDRRLTPEEIARDRQVRAAVEQEKPEIDARIRQEMAKLRKAKAAEQRRTTLGERIREIREVRGLSQISLADAAGISQGYLSQLERDEREPSLSIAARIARALNLSLDDIAATVAS